MELFERMELHDYEQVVVCQDRNSGLKAIIAIHDTTLGPALGGTRMWTYENEEAAFEDVLRLAKGMTYKNAAAGLNLGGGKAVIIGDARTDKNEEMFRAFGRYIEGLAGRYITAEDVGTTEHDMDIIHEETNFVTGISLSAVSGSSGNPSPVTARGVYQGMKAAAKEAFGTDDLAGRTIAVQGVGHVSFEMCRFLYEEGASLIVTDIREASVERAIQAYGAKAVAPEEIYDVPCDIFSPCALGGGLNEHTILRLQAKVVAGAANNQLQTEEDGNRLEERGIVYAPDYIINAGGVINIADELYGYDRERALKKVDGIYDNIVRVFEIAGRDGIPLFQAANRMAEERIKSIKRSRKQFLPHSRHILTNR